jgi:hypothetical protein
MVEKFEWELGMRQETEKCIKIIQHINIDENIDLIKWGVRMKYEKMDTYLN